MAASPAAIAARLTLKICLERIDVSNKLRISQHISQTDTRQTETLAEGSQHNQILVIIDPGGN